MHYLEKMEVARAILLKKAPYISTMLYSLVPHESSCINTIATTAKLVLVYNPEWFGALTDEEAAGILFHETQHPLRRHYERGEHFPDKYQANKAMDIPINDDIRAMGLTLPSDGTFRETYGFPPNLTTEEYYELLEDEKSRKGRSSDGASPGVPTEGSCGGAAGNPLPNEEELEKEVEQLSPGATKSPVEVEVVLRRQAEEIEEYVRKNGRGSIPSSIVEWAAFEVKPPKVSWRQALQRRVRHAAGRVISGGKDYSKRRPSSRSFIRGHIVPGLVSHEPEVAFIRDTSGSMGDKQLQDAQNEAIGAFKAIGVKHVWFMDADADANRPKRISIKEIPKLPITGRGGTDFRPAIEVITKLRPRPQLVIYFTDGDGPAPEQAPAGITFIWVILPSYHNEAPCAWGHHIFVKDDEEEAVDAY